MHYNRLILFGRIGPRGVRLTYNSAGTPICSFTIEVDKPGRDGKVYTSYHGAEITGKQAEHCAETLAAGDEVLLEGEHQYRSTVDPSTKEKKTKSVLSTWGVTQRIPATATAPVQPELSPN